jgi:dTDP-glucose pyrophosphorylase
MKFIFLVRAEDCSTHHLDDTLKVLTNGHCHVIKVEKPTHGAACTVLLAIDHINSNEELVISNGNQVIEHDLNKAIDAFRSKKADAGTICFESIHPKWSYVRTDENNLVVELAEKRPISNRAIAGFYYFKNGSSFVNAAFESIKKDAHVNNAYFIAPCMNELVLLGKEIRYYDLGPNQYHSFYTPQKIKEYLDLKK